jgi:hypothetical protein
MDQRPVDLVPGHQLDKLVPENPVQALALVLVIRHLRLHNRQHSHCIHPRLR